MDAVLLVDGHLVFFEVEVSDALPEDTGQEVVGLVLVGEPGSWNGFEPSKEVHVGLVALNDGVERVFGELVVVAVVAESGSALGKVSEGGLILLLEKCVLGGHAVGNWFEVLGKDGNGHSDYENQDLLKTHNICSVPEGKVVARTGLTHHQGCS